MKRRSMTANSASTGSANIPVRADAFNATRVYTGTLGYARREIMRQNSFKSWIVAIVTEDQTIVDQAEEALLLIIARQDKGEPCAPSPTT
jgi:hypothetical protein